MSQGSTCLQRWRLALLLLVLAALVPAWAAKGGAKKSAGSDAAQVSDSKADVAPKKKKGKKAKKEKEAAVAPQGQGESQTKKPFAWPDSQMGLRTSDRVSAGKRAAKWISCPVCYERIFSLFLETGEVENMDAFMEEQASALVGDVKELCGMPHLAVLFKARRLEIETSEDGSAKLVTAQEGKSPTYDEINTSELAFHWKSFALQHACMETFRRDGDAIIEDLKEAWLKSRANDVEERGEEPSYWFKRLAALIRTSCGKARTCKAQLKLQGREEL